MAWSQGKPFDEIQIQIGILNDKLEAIQESVNDLNGTGNQIIQWFDRLPAAERFVVSGPLPGTSIRVLDKETGLVWMQSVQGVTNRWADARVGVFKLNLACPPLRSW